MGFEAAIASYLGTRLPDAHDVQVTKVYRIPGGASRETWSVDAEWTEGNGKKHRQGFIIRRDPTASLVHSEREIEFAFYQSFAENEAVPVPRPFWLETDAALLERPFFVMERIDGCESQFQKLLDPTFAPHLPGLGRRMYEVLGDIAGTALENLPAARVVDVPHPVECWRRELDYWERMIDENELEPQPIARAGIRWLRRNPPPAPARTCVVHGDYRTGNFLYRNDVIHGILDWEMAHFGDPLEDLAWSFSECWQWARDGRAGGIIDRASAIRVWEERTGWQVDGAALHWWDVFSCIKGQALWLTGAQEFASGRASDLVLAFTSYWLINSQDKFLLRQLGRLPV
jgi:aminoglycoside phosphotransferase (APT) family kinase protein